jgi:hypothetical protein
MMLNESTLRFVRVPVLLTLALLSIASCAADQERPSHDGDTVKVPKGTRAVIFIDEKGKVQIAESQKFHSCRLCYPGNCPKAADVPICKSSERKRTLTEIEGITAVRTEGSPACVVLKTWYENGIYHERCDDD